MVAGEIEDKIEQNGQAIVNITSEILNALRRQKTTECLKLKDLTEAKTENH